MAVVLMSLYDLAKQIARRAKEKRLALNLSQAGLSSRAGVSLGSLKKFEQTAQISLQSLLKLALVLDGLEGFAELFSSPRPETVLSLDELLKENKRKRGRKA